MRPQLDRFAAAGKLQVYYALDHPPQGWKGGTGFVNKQPIQGHLPAASKDTKILLCGPPPMVNGSKKALVELGFEKPGAVLDRALTASGSERFSLTSYLTTTKRCLAMVPK